MTWLLLAPPRASRPPSALLRLARCLEQIAPVLIAGAFDVRRRADRPHLIRAWDPRGRRAVLDQAGDFDFAAYLGAASGRPVRAPRSPPEPPLFVSPKDEERFTPLAYRLLAEAGRCGARVNYSRELVSFGVKSTLELRLRAFEARGGAKVPRPRTWIARPRREASTMRELREAEFPCLVKPANKSRGRGIRIIRSPAELGEVDSTSVVQELAESPLIVEGRKVDFRVYVVVWNEPELRYHIPRFVLVRFAPHEYRRASLESEICNSSYSKRLLIDPRLSSLDALAGDTGYDGLRAAIESTVTRLMRAVALHPPQHRFFGVWGLDLLIVERRGRLEAKLLEVNTFPQLYRDHEAADADVDEMMRVEVAPLLARVMRGNQLPNCSPIAPATNLAAR